MKMSDLKKKILMKIRRMEYKNVNFSKEYLETEQKYKKLRDNLSNVISSIGALMNYEHGGSAQKKLFQGLSVISSASSMNLFNNNDVFEAMSIVTGQFATDDDDKITNESNKMSKAYRKVSEFKVRFNDKCSREMESLKEMKKKAEYINKERDNAKIYRYDLENCKQNETEENREEHDRYEESYDKATNQALSMMIDFIGDDGVQGVLKRVLEYQIDFFKSSLEELERAK